MPTGLPTTNSKKYPNVKQLSWAINYLSLCSMLRKGLKNQKDAGRRKALFRCSTENGVVLRLSRMFEVPLQIRVLRATEFSLNISRIFAHTARIVAKNSW